MTPAEINRKIEKLLAALERRLSALLFRLPTRLIHIDETGNEQVISETPWHPRFKGVAYKVYFASDDWNPDQDGVDL